MIPTFSLWNLSGWNDSSMTMKSSTDRRILTASEAFLSTWKCVFSYLCGLCSGMKYYWRRLFGRLRWFCPSILPRQLGEDMRWKCLKRAVSSTAKNGRNRPWLSISPPTILNPSPSASLQIWTIRNSANSFSTIFNAFEERGRCILRLTRSPQLLSISTTSSCISRVISQSSIEMRRVPASRTLFSVRNYILIKTIIVIIIIKIV